MRPLNRWVSGMGILALVSAAATPVSGASPAAFPGAPSSWTVRNGGVPKPVAGTWEEVTMAEYVVLNNGTFHMIYLGRKAQNPFGRGDRGRKFGVATSTDGLSWKKFSGNPVLAFQGTTRDSDFGVNTAVIGRNPDGSVAKLGGKWVMVFLNYDGVNGKLQWATSPDGFRWTERGQTGITRAPPGNGDRGETHGSSLVRDTDGTWYCYYFGGGGSRALGVATGSSPKNLTPYSGNPILKPTQAWEGRMTHMADVFKDSQGWVMTYGSDFTKRNLGWARSSDLINWTKQGKLLNEGMSQANMIWWSPQNGQVRWRIYLTFTKSRLPQFAEATLNVSGDTTPPVPPAGLSAMPVP